MNTFEQVRGIIANKMDRSQEQIAPATSLKGDLHADSLDIVEITMALEEAFCMNFGEEALLLESVQQIVEYIERKPVFRS